MAALFNPFRRSIRAQLIIGVALVHAVLMTFFVWDMVSKQERVLYEQVHRSTQDFVRTFAHSISLWLASGDYQGVQDALENSMEQLNDVATLLVFDMRGQVVAHNDPHRVGQYVVDPDSRRLLAMSAGKADYQVLNDREDWLDVAAPVRLEGKLLGWVRLQRDLKHLASQQRAIIWEGVAYTLFAILVGSLLAWWIGVHLTRRLEQLKMVTQRVAQGERDVEVPQDQGYADELADLSRHFAAMLRQLRDNERQYVAERDRMIAILGVLPEAVVEVDAHGRIVYANPMFEQLAHQTAVQLKQRPLMEAIHVEDGEGDPLWCRSENVAQEKVVRKVRVWVVHPDTEQREEMLLRILPRRLEGALRHVVLLFEHMSESQHLLEELAWQRDHDLLTKLYNRHALERHLMDLQEAIRVDGRPRYLIQFNLDHFKHINDVAGFSVGDQILQEVAQVLYQQLGNDAFLARLGGDDFVAVIDMEGGPEAACELGRRIIRTIEKYPFSWADQRFVLSMSAGVVRMDVGTSAEEALLKLDYAVHHAKETGDGQCIVYEDGQLDTRTKFEQIGWLNEIKHALQEDRFVLFLQPVVPLDGRRKRTGEVLVRLKTERGELASPYHFLPVAERFGLMTTLDLHIVRKAIDWLQVHPDTVDQLNINLSGLLLQQRETRQALMRLVMQQPESVRSRLCFEVTETAAIYDIAETAEVLRQLRASGCKVAIDDFGSGYASFNYLKSLPADFVKIDGAFVRDMNEDRVNFAMVRAITTVAHEMGIEVVAEFVETHEVALTLQAQGVEYAQGYYFSPPLPIDEVDDGLWQVDLASQ